jgi:peptidoglycan/xylan/chitin deacetylase (PgdA/CDA1 family)
MTLLATTLIPSLQGFGPVMRFFEQAGNQIWLTIDDGPNPTTTPAILELLDRFNAKATFFLIGDKAVAAPHLVRMILERGHSIGNHTQTHPQLRFWRLGPKRLRKEIDDFERTMSDRGFPVPSLFRAPTGMKNPFLHPVLATRRLLLVGWSARAYDTRVKQAATVAGRLLQIAAPGSILLLHEDSPVSVQTLEILLHRLAERQMSCVIPASGQLRIGRLDPKANCLDCEPTWATFWRWGSITQSWRRFSKRGLM